MSTINIRRISLPCADEREIIRYIGGADEKTKVIIHDLLAEHCDVLSQGSVCYLTLPMHKSDSDKSASNLLSVSAFKQSHDIQKYLSDCTDIILFAATVGIGIDRLIMKHSSLSPATALILQAIGAERTEALCDSFTESLKQSEQYKNSVLKPRYSPGYGDLPLEVQKDIFRILNPEKHIGLCLNDSLIMSPSKSVTALIGIKTKDMEKQ